MAKSDEEAVKAQQEQGSTGAKEGPAEDRTPTKPAGQADDVDDVSPAATRRQQELDEEAARQEEREGYARRIQDQADKAGETPKK
jgi:hypothetical protein